MSCVRILCVCKIAEVYNTDVEDEDEDDDDEDLSSCAWGVYVFEWTRTSPLLSTV